MGILKDLKDAINEDAEIQQKGDQVNMHVVYGASASAFKAVKPHLKRALRQAEKDLPQAAKSLGPHHDEHSVNNHYAMGAVHRVHNFIESGGDWQKLHGEQGRETMWEAYLDSLKKGQHGFSGAPANRVAIGELLSKHGQIDLERRFETFIEKEVDDILHKNIGKHLM